MVTMGNRDGMTRRICELLANKGLLKFFVLLATILSANINSAWCTSLQFIATSDKPIFERGEPIGVELTLTNLADSEVCVLPLSPFTHDLEIILSKSGGERVPFSGMRFDYSGAPDYDCLAPHESENSTINIAETHGSTVSYQGLVFMLDPGTYELSFVCRTLVGETVQSNTVLFTVALPRENDSAWACLVRSQTIPLGDMAARIDGYRDFVLRYGSHPALPQFLCALQVLDKANSVNYGKLLLQQCPDSPKVGLVIKKLYSDLPREEFLRLMARLKDHKANDRATRIAVRLLNANAKTKLADEIGRVQ
jgi:hypothetical protein